MFVFELNMYYCCEARRALGQATMVNKVGFQARQRVVDTIIIS